MPKTDKLSNSIVLYNIIQSRAALRSTSLQPIEAIKLWLEYKRTGDLPEAPAPVQEQNCTMIINTTPSIPVSTPTTAAPVDSVTCGTKSLTYFLGLPLTLANMLPCSSPVNIGQDGGFVLPMLAMSLNLAASKVCALHFNVTISHGLCTMTKIGPNPFQADKCIDVTVSDYKSSGFESVDFSMYSNNTGAQMKAISFSMSGLSTPDNSMLNCSSFEGAPAPRNNLAMFEQGLMENTNIASGGTYYMLDNIGTSIPIALYQNTSGVFIVLTNEGIPQGLISIESLCQSTTMCDNTVCVAGVGGMDMFHITDK